MFWRLTAQRLLVESGETDILEDLYQLIRDESTDGTGLNPGALHALWTLEGLDVLSGDEQAMEVVKGALSHPVGAVRKAAIQILSGSKSADEAMIQSNVLNDKEPQVQLAALLYFSDREPSDKIGEILYESSQESRVRQDRWLAQAIYLTATRHIEGFMAAFTEDHPDFKTHFDATKSLQNESFNQGQLAESLARNYYQQEGRGKVSNDLNGKSVVVEIGTIKNEMKYDLTEFVVEAGRPVELIFENDDFMQHNVVIGQPGATEKIGTAADKLATDPNGLDKAYVPQIPEVLYATSLVDPQQTAVLRFTAPLKPGLNPFICTFPGHWRIMQGVMKVVAVNPEI
jgi:azurin